MSCLSPNKGAVLTTMSTLTEPLSSEEHPSFHFFKEDGKYWGLKGRRVCLSGLVSSIMVDGILTPLTSIQKLTADRFTVSNNLFELNIKLQKTKFFEIGCTIRNLSEKEFFVQKVIIAGLNNGSDKSGIFLGGNPEAYRIFLNSFDSWGKTGSRPWIKRLGIKQQGDRLHDHSSLVSAIWSVETRNCFVIGATEMGRFPSFFCWTDLQDAEKPSFSMGRDLYISIKPNETLHLGWFMLSETTSLVDGLRDYASYYFKPLKTAKDFFYGWSTWDYYLSYPTFEDVKENARYIKATPFLASHIKVISIDAGWFHMLGDWRANIDFESNRADCARWIQQQGFIPGIWSTPLLVHPSARLVVERPDWFINGPDGMPLNVNETDPLATEKIYCLDFTVKAVQDYIYSLYRQQYNEGYRYFKLDFLKACCAQPHIPLMNKSVTRLEMLRNCISVIRQAVSSKSAICACGAPFEAVQGIVDFVRTSDDVKNFWSNIQRTARSVVHRFWTHSYLWYADPDFCVVRGLDTGGLSPHRFPLPIPSEHIPFRWISGHPFTKNEAQVWATVQIISGGPIILSDRLTSLNLEGKRILQTIFDHHSITPFEPLDLMDSPIPSLWCRINPYKHGKEKKYDMIALFNWWDEPKPFDISFLAAEHPWFEVWENKQLQLNSPLIIQPRSAKLLRQI